MKTLLLCLPFASFLLLTGCSQAPTETAPNAEILEKVEAFAATTQKMEQRIAALEKTNRMLEGELNLMKVNAEAASDEDAQPDLNEQVAEIVNNELGELIAAKLDEQSGGEGLTQQLLVSSFNQQMTAYEEQKEAEEEARREERRQQEEERRAEMQAERLARTAQELGINDTQAEQLAVAMDTMRQEARTFFEEMRESGNFDRDAAREQMTKLRELHLEVTSQFLNAEQQAAYTEMSDRGGFGGFGPPDGGRGGRGGRGR